MMIEQADSHKLEQHQLKKLRNLDVFLLGRRITCMTVPAIVDAIHTACIESDKLTVANYNVHSFNLSMQVPWFYNFLQNADIAHCDSIGILSAIRLMGLKLPLQYRASYSLLMPELLAHCNQHCFSVFLLGAKPEYLQTAIAQLQEQYPALTVDGHHGYFDMNDPDQNGRVVQQINSIKPNILIVGMGMPIQESWIQKNRHQLDVNVIMPGGAIIDRMAGVVPDCPAVLSNVGLEWFYRLCREPKRLAARYLFGNPAFALHLALARTYSSSLKVQLMKPVNRKARQRRSESDPIDSKFLETYLLETGLITSTQVEVELG